MFVSCSCSKFMSRVVLGKDFRIRVVFVFKVHVSCRVRVVLGKDFRVRVVFG